MPRADQVHSLVLSVPLSLCGCAHVTSSTRAEKRFAPKALPGVGVVFERLASPVDFAEQRMMESGSLPQSQKSGDAPRFRLSNQSGVTISIPTWSTYWRPPAEWDSLPGGKRVLSLKDGVLSWLIGLAP